MESQAAVRLISKKYPSIPEDEIRYALDSEASNEERRLQGTGARNQYAKAVDTAYNRILAWIDDADEYRVSFGDPESIIRFVSSHRQACVWSVLRGMTLKAEVQS